MMFVCFEGGWQMVYYHFFLSYGHDVCLLWRGLTNGILSLFSLLRTWCLFALKGADKWYTITFLLSYGHDVCLLWRGLTNGILSLFSLLRTWCLFALKGADKWYTITFLSPTDMMFVCFEGGWQMVYYHFSLSYGHDVCLLWRGLTNGILSLFSLLRTWCLFALKGADKWYTITFLSPTDMMFVCFAGSWQMVYYHFFLSYGHDVCLLCRELTNGILSLFSLLRTWCLFALQGADKWYTITFFSPTDMMFVCFAGSWQMVYYHFFLSYGHDVCLLWRGLTNGILSLFSLLRTWCLFALKGADKWYTITFFSPTDMMFVCFEGGWQMVYYHFFLSYGHDVCLLWRGLTNGILSLFSLLRTWCLFALKGADKWYTITFFSPTDMMFVCFEGGWQMVYYHFFLSYGHDVCLLCRELTNGILSLFSLLRTWCLFALQGADKWYTITFFSPTDMMFVCFAGSWQMVYYHFFLSYGHDVCLLCRELTNGILSLFSLLRTWCLFALKGADKWYTITFFSPTDMMFVCFEGGWQMVYYHFFLSYGHDVCLLWRGLTNGILSLFSLLRTWCLFALKGADKWYTITFFSPTDMMFVCFEGGWQMVYYHFFLSYGHDVCLLWRGLTNGILSLFSLLQTWLFVCFEGGWQMVYYHFSLSLGHDACLLCRELTNGILSLFSLLRTWCLLALKGADKWYTITFFSPTDMMFVCFEGGWQMVYYHFFLSYGHDVCLLCRGLTNGILSLFSLLRTWYLLALQGADKWYTSVWLLLLFPLLRTWCLFALKGADKWYTITFSLSLGLDTCLLCRELTNGIPVFDFCPFFLSYGHDVCWLCRELTNGIPVFDENGNRLGVSRRAATSAIAQVVVSRILMATPGMCQYCFLFSCLSFWISTHSLFYPTGNNGGGGGAVQFCRKFHFVSVWHMKMRGCKLAFSVWFLFSFPRFWIIKRAL